MFIKVITKLPNSEQSYKGKVQTHNYINRQNQKWVWIVVCTKKGQKPMDNGNYNAKNQNTHPGHMRGGFSHRGSQLYFHITRVSCAAEYPDNIYFIQNNDKHNQLIQRVVTC
jgi:hypothetical protein